MSGDELKIVTDTPKSIDEDYVGNMDAVIELLVTRRGARRRCTGV